MIPELTKDAIDRYVKDHCMPGSFVRAVLENDLLEAAVLGDDKNRAALAEIVDYCFSKIPSRCWRSPSRVQAWLNEAKP